MAKDDARPRQFAGRDLSDVDSIDAAVLTPIVRNALGSPAFAVTDWTRQPVRGARASTTAGIYRVVGNTPPPDRRGGQSSSR